jgi:molecular chaperone DnaK (HSP70)
MQPEVGIGTTSTSLLLLLLLFAHLVHTGIDLGTSYCSVGIWRDGELEVIPNERGSRRTPSFISFTDSNFLVGEDARDSGNPETVTFTSISFFPSHS